MKLTFRTIGTDNRAVGSTIFTQNRITVHYKKLEQGSCGLAV
uniref:Uncharacterized protein n=1 Tax=Arundo donax TaxID=35708 RepID=A0A0A8Z7T6_ARUDO